MHPRLSQASLIPSTLQWYNPSSVLPSSLTQLIFLSCHSTSSSFSSSSLSLIYFLSGLSDLCLFLCHYFQPMHPPPVSSSSSSSSLAHPTAIMSMAMLNTSHSPISGSHGRDAGPHHSHMHAIPITPLTAHGTSTAILSGFKHRVLSFLFKRAQSSPCPAADIRFFYAHIEDYTALCMWKFQLLGEFDLQ